MVSPCTVTEAREFVRAHHRHLPEPPPSGRWAVALTDDEDQLHGVALVGFGARLNNDRRAATVTRVATDGSPNANSMLYGAVARIWKAMGGKVLYTYILDCETGQSLKAAGWVHEGDVEAREGHGRPSRPRALAVQPGPKQRWVWRVG